MTRSLYILFFLSIAVSSTSAQGVWTWMHGDTFFQSTTAANRGLIGVQSNSTMPYAVDWAKLTVWSDNNDNMWLMHNDTIGWATNTLVVWKYNLVNNQWTWMAGYDSFKITGAYSQTIRLKTALRN